VASPVVHERVFSRILRIGPPGRRRVVRVRVPETRIRVESNQNRRRRDDHLDSATRSRDRET